MLWLISLNASSRKIEDLTGLGWSLHLPNNIILAISIVTLISLIAALVMRLSNPAQRIISTFDDYFSWLVTFLPVATGIVATSHLGARYETLLAVHAKAGDFLEQTVMGEPSEPLTEGPGTVIGRYKLLEKIGEGGMAEVFLADQMRPLRRKVARLT